MTRHRDERNGIYYCYLVLISNVNIHAQSGRRLATHSYQEISVYPKTTSTEREVTTTVGSALNSTETEQARVPGLHPTS